MPVDENKVSEAFGIVDDAEALVQQGEFAKAIFKFQQAISLFDKCGLAPAKKRKVMDMVSDRQAEVARIQQKVKEHPELFQSLVGTQAASAPPQVNDVPQNKSSQNISIEMNPVTSIPSSPSVDLAMAEREGVLALKKANDLVEQGQYQTAIQIFYDAAEKLVMAGWDESALMNIQKQVQVLAEFLQKSEMVVEAPQAVNVATENINNSIPTFAQVNQVSNEPSSSRNRSQNVPEQVYTPSFAQFSTQGQNVPQKTIPQPNVVGAAEYVPSYTQYGAQTPQIAAKSPVQSTPMAQHYSPTFAQTAATQGNVIPNNPRPQNVSNPQDYVPTFMQVPSANMQNAQKSASNSQNIPQTAYTPSFANVASTQGTPIPQPQPQRPIITPQAQDYVPTFVQVPASQPNSASQKPIGVASNPNTGYTPTFANIPQTMPNYAKPVQNLGSPSQDYIPTFAQTQQGTTIHPAIPKATGAAHDYIPTFAQTQQGVPINTPIPKTIGVPQITAPTFTSVPTTASGVFDPEEFKKLMNNVRSAKPANTVAPTFTQTGQQDIVSSPQIPQNVSANSQMGPTFTATGQKDVISANPKPIATLIPSGPTFQTLNNTSQMNTLANNILSQFKSQQEQYRSMQQEAQVLIDNARNLEKDGKYQLSIEQIEDAIDMLNSMPGWAEQSQALFIYLHKLQNYLDTSAIEGSKMDVAKLDALQKEVVHVLSAQLNDERAAATVKSSFDFTQDAHSLFDQKIKNDSKIQQTALDNLEHGLSSISNAKYDDALTDYNKASLLLNSIGWNAQCSQLQPLINTLVEMKKQSENSLVGNEPVLQDGMTNDQMKQALQKQFEARRSKISEMEAEKARKEQDQVKAFSFIEEAEKCMEKNQFEAAFEKYRDAATLLISAGWQEQLGMINQRIAQFRQERDAAFIREQEAHRHLLEKQQQEAQLQRQVQSAMREKQKQMEQEKQAQAAINAQKQQMEQLQKQIYEIFRQADLDINKGDYNSAIAKYNSAKEVMAKSGWSVQLSVVDNLISNAQTQKNARDAANTAQKIKAERVHQEQNQFQVYLKQQADFFAKEQENKKRQLENFVRQKETLEKTQAEAFKFMDIAERSLKLHQFDEAISALNQSIAAFKAIGWNSQIQYILQQINQVQNDRDQFNASLSQADKERQMAAQAAELAKKQAQQQEQQEMKSLFDIKSMIKNVTGQKSEEQKLKETRLSERDKMRTELDSWRSQSKSSLSSLRAELMADEPDLNLSKIKSEEASKVQKEKAEMMEFRDMIRSVAKKTTDKK